MAIDDNTLYGLTGAQVKELPERIEAVKGLAKVLTADDYNYPTDNPTTVALWLLEPGIYSWQSGVSVWRGINYTISGPASAFVAYGGTGFKQILWSENYSNWKRANVNNTTGAGSSKFTIISSDDVINNLTSTSTDYPLSANQGKVLNDKIGGDLSNLTTTDKTSLINAINEVAGQSGGSYTAGDGIDITNSVISATNTGKARVLTEDDYNWNSTAQDAVTTPFDSVALWLLDPGFYQCASLKVSTYKGWAFTRTSNIIVSKDKNLTEARIIMDNLTDNATLTIFTTTIATGARVAARTDTLLAQSNVQDNLTSNQTNYPLSAKQGKVLKGLIDSIAIRGAGAPTTSTVGEVGQLYEDTTNGTLYQLKSIDTTVTPNTYNWEQVGGSSVNVVQTTGNSTTDVMSQAAATSMVYLSVNSTQTIRIGNTAAVGSLGVGIGYSSRATGDRAVGLGYNAYATAPGAVAIGPGSNATSQGQMDIGTTSTGHGYNSSNYRLLTGLYDPQNAHDAATKGYVDTAVSGISVPDTFTTNEWDALWA